MQWHPTISARGPRRRLSLVVLAALALLVIACGQPTRVASTSQLGAATPGSTPAMQRALAALTQQQAALRQQRILDDTVNWYLGQMSLDDELGQMLMNRCACGSGTYTPDLATMIQQQHIGGLIFYADNFGGSLSDIQALMQQIQANAPLPLFTGTDQEGGWVNRIGKYYGFLPSPQNIVSSGNPQVAYASGAQVAQDLLAMGINTDIAPVLDVPLDPNTSWIGYRTFSSDPKTVALFAGQYVAGLQSHGAIATLKHFPGIGSITQDPHDTLPVISRTLAQFQQTELYPYQQILPEAPGMIMSTDVLIPSVDPTYPAELSPIWIDGILRQQMGYQGVVATDAIWMSGITEHWSITQASVLAVQAGDDIIEGAANAAMSQQILDALKGAVVSGQISKARIDQSVRRILRLKLAYGMISIPPQIEVLKLQFGATPATPADFRYPHLVVAR
jgi:beta-N-acetylhexosaminidase